MKNLEINGFQELNEKELKAVGGGRWNWAGALMGAVAGFMTGGPVGAAVGAAVGGFIFPIYY